MITKLDGNFVKYKYIKQERVVVIALIIFMEYRLQKNKVP